MFRGVAVQVASVVVIHAHLEHMRWRNLSPGTIRQRRYTLGRFARFLDEHSEGRHPVEATHHDILAFRDRRTRARQPLALSTIGAELGHLSSFYKWLQVEGHRPDNPMLKVPRPRLPRWMPHPMPEHDLARAIETAPERIVPWLYLAAYAGLRACEIAPLRADDLWWHTDPPLLVVRAGKGGDPGTVPISPTLAQGLAGLPLHGWLFPRGDDRPGHVMPHTVSQLANKHLHRIGINETLHSLRHRFGTQVYRASGQDLRQTQELMRHRSIVSTAGYTMVDRSEAAGIVGALPPPVRAIA